MANSIVAFNHGGSAFAGGTVAFSCSDVFGNEGGDWVGPIAGQAGLNGNIGLDPLFCNPAAHSFSLQDNSPCRGYSPESPTCDRMGAWLVGCSAGVADARGASVTPILQVIPNPTSGACRFLCALRQPGAPVVTVFDASGRLVRRMELGWSSPGEISFPWNGRDETGQALQSGVYLVRMSGAGEAASGRLILVR